MNTSETMNVSKNNPHQLIRLAVCLSLGMALAGCDDTSQALDSQVLDEPVRWGPPLGSPIDDTVVQMRVSEVPQRAGQVISIFTRFKLPKGKHLYSAAIKKPGVETEFEFRGQGFELAGSIKEPDPLKVQCSPIDWTLEQRAEEICKLRIPLPLWKELFMSKKNWYQTIRKRRLQQEAAEFLAVQANQ